MKRTAVVKSKPIHQSKTFWFNALGLLVVLIPAIQGWAQVTVLILPTWFTEILSLLLVLGNVTLRYLTRQPLTLASRPGAAVVEAPDTDTP